MHSSLEEYGRKATAIVAAARDIYGTPSTVQEDVLSGTQISTVLSMSLHVLLHYPVLSKAHFHYGFEIREEHLLDLLTCFAGYQVRGASSP